MTSSHLDRATHTPAYKELSVKMTVLPEKGELAAAAAELPVRHAHADGRR